MPKFKYKIRETSGAEGEGKEIIGEVEAVDRFAAAADLRNRGKIVISIEDVVSGAAFNWRAINLMFARVSEQELVVFAHNLNTMMTAGLPLSRALSIIERQTKNKLFKETIVSLVDDIGRGSTLSVGMQKFPKIFSPLFVSMVRAGEESGGLSQSLLVIGNQLEKSYLLKKKIKGAMIYPSVVLTTLVIIGVLMFVFVVPTIASTFKELKTELPFSTKIIIGLSDFLSQHWLTAALIVGAIVAFFVVTLRTKKGRRAYEFTLFHLPVVGELVRESNAARTARTLSSLLSSGVDMLGSITITGDVLQNSYYKDAMKVAGDQAQKGIPLSSVFVDHQDIYPSLIGDMVEVGEETGKLSEMLLNVATFYENEVDDATKNMSTIIEPVLMVVIGASVGFFAVSMISPMYSVMSNI